MFYPAHECENELETAPTRVGVMKPRFAHFTIELNDSRWISEMVRWKATSKGFLTGHLQEPSGVIKPNRELRQSCCRVSQDGVCLKLERYLPTHNSVSILAAGSVPSPSKSGILEKIKFFWGSPNCKHTSSRVAVR